MPKRKKYGVLPPLSEDELLEAVLDAGRSLGYLAYHTHDSRHSESGYPDVNLIGHGMSVWAELKKEGEKMTAAQERWAVAIGELPHPCWHFLVYPSNFEAFLERLMTFREEHRVLRDTPPAGDPVG